MDFVWQMSGVEWALLGAVSAAIGGGIGSAIGIAVVSGAVTGVVSEDSNKFGRLLPLTTMPGTQGIYGFITTLLVFIFIGFFEGEPQLTATEGIRVFLSCLPVAFVCLFSGIYQGVAAIGSVGMVARRDEDAGKALIFPALVETYAVFALILSVLMLTIVTG